MLEDGIEKKISPASIFVLEYDIVVKSEAGVPHWHMHLDLHSLVGFVVLHLLYLVQHHLRVRDRAVFLARGRK